MWPDSESTNSAGHSGDGRVMIVLEVDCRKQIQLLHCYLEIGVRLKPILHGAKLVV